LAVHGFDFGGDHSPISRRVMTEHRLRHRTIAQIAHVARLDALMSPRLGAPDHIEIAPLRRIQASVGESWVRMIPLACCEIVTNVRFVGEGSAVTAKHDAPKTA